MTEGWGDLNGSGPQQVYINVYRTGQDWGGNFSRYHITVRYLGKGYGSWTTDTQSWSADAGGQGWSGNFSIPYAQRYDDITLLEADFIRYHDGNGFGSSFVSSAYISTNHGSIGSGGVWIGEETPPRIPKPPTAPQNLTVVNLTPTSAGVQYSGPADWRGSSLVRYIADWYEINNIDNPRVWQDLNSNGYTSPANGAGPELKPGSTYHVYVYAESNVGYGANAMVGFTTITGGRRKVDGVWRRVARWRKVNGSWRRVARWRKVDGTWRRTG